MSFAGRLHLAQVGRCCEGITVATILVLTLGGCFRLGAMLPPALDVTDFWQGVSVVNPSWSGAHGAGIGYGIQLISFTLFEEGSKISGFYACERYTAECGNRGLDENGPIDGGVIAGDEVNFRVTFASDLSSCIFGGRFSIFKGQGSYHCYAGGGLIEAGKWNVSRAGVSPQLQAGPRLKPVP